MKKESFQIKETFPVKPSVIYHAWLDSDEHSEMTGGEASCSKKEGDIFTAWDGYIIGKNIKLIKDMEILQNWRTSDFDDTDEDSVLNIKLSETPTGCDLILTHNNIPPGQDDYKQGWIDFYFTPMKAYFKTK